MIKNFMFRVCECPVWGKPFVLFHSSLCQTSLRLWHVINRLKRTPIVSKIWVSYMWQWLHLQLKFLGEHSCSSKNYIWKPAHWKMAWKLFFSDATKKWPVTRCTTCYLLLKPETYQCATRAPLLLCDFSRFRCTYNAPFPVRILSTRENWPIKLCISALLIFQLEKVLLVRHCTRSLSYETTKIPFQTVLFVCNQMRVF